VSISWDTIRPVLLSLFEDLGGFQTVWQDKRRPFVDPKAQAVVLLHVRQAAGIGVDDRRYEDLNLVAPAPTLEEQQAGHRRVGLDVRVESFRHDDNRFAFNAAETIRTKLRFASSLARLRAVNVALVRAEQTLDVSGIVQDDRATSVAVLDLTLNVGVCIADDANHVYNIESVDFVGTVLPDP
jgi:hypothetical protein